MSPALSAPPPFPVFVTASVVACSMTWITFPWLPCPLWFRAPSATPAATATATAKTASAAMRFIAPPCFRVGQSSHDRGYTVSRRPGDRGARERFEESPDTAGQDAGATQAAKADGKWHRKETAGEGSRETSKVRVKRWGKSPPASWRHGG